MKQVHIALQARGGIGKSFVCFLLAQYINAKGGQALCVDTDSVNGTFGSFRQLNAVKLDIFDGKTIDHGKFDDLIELVLDSNTDVVVDNGASVFLPFRQYMIENRLAQTLADADKELVIHTVLTGGQAMTETVNGLVHLVDDFPRKAPHGPTIVAWLNPYWGPVERNGRWFEEFPEYKMMNRGEKTEVLRMPEYQPLFQQDLENMLRMRLTFDEALTSGEFWLLNLQRLAMIRRELFTLMDSVKSLSPSGSDKKARTITMDPNVQAMIKNIEQQYKIAIKPGDPLVAALAANDLILEKYNEASHTISDQLGAEVKIMIQNMTAKVDDLNATIETTSTKLVHDSKIAACQVGDAAVTVAKRELLEASAVAKQELLKAGEEIGTKVRAMYDNIYSEIRFERWLCLGSAILCIVFAIFGFLATR